MLRTWIDRIAWAGAAAVAALPVVSLYGQTVGVNAAVRNDVKVRQTQAAAAKEARRGEQVKLGNLFTTGRSSAVQIALLDKTSITVGPDARLTIDRFVYDPARSSSSVRANVVKGTFRFLSGKSQAGERSVATPSATIGIRGTMLEGAVGENALTIARLQPGFVVPDDSDPETASFIVLRGPGPNAPPSERRGQIAVTAGGVTEALDRPGQAVFIPRAGAAPIRLDLQGPAYEPFDVMLRTAPDTFSYAAASLLLQPVQPPGGPLPPAGQALPGQAVGSVKTISPWIGVGVFGAVAIGLIIEGSGSQPDSEGLPNPRPSPSPSPSNGNNV